MSRAAVTAAGLLALLLPGCGSGAGSTQEPDTALPPVVSAAPALLPDGTVPWVDEPAGLREFDSQPPPPPERGDAEPCTADDLTGSLPAWVEQGDGGEEEVRRPTPGLYGWVLVRLIGKEPCTLQGLVSARLRIDGQDAEVQYSNSVNEQARQRLTVVTETSPAELRIDWSPPYCGPQGAQELLVELPDDGGVLRAGVEKPRTPVCTGPDPEGDRGLRTYLSTSVFERWRAPTPLDSPLRVLRATLEGAPRSVRPGQVVDYVVRLTNPTGRDVSLEPCPGYYASRFVLGTEGRVGFNDGQVYRLNCRPVAAVPANSSVAFRMRAQVPQEPPGGPTFDVTWRLVAPRLAGEPALQIGFSSRVEY